MGSSDYEKWNRIPCKICGQKLCNCFEMICKQCKKDYLKEKYGGGK